MNIGAQLRQARESRGLSIAALAAATRIQPRMLDAIERNDLSTVPTGPYARGFVAAISRELGLDPDAIVRAFFAQFGEPAVTAQTAPAIVAPVVQDDRWRQWLPAAAVLALLVMVAVLFSGRTEAPSGPEAAVGTTGSGSPQAAGTPRAAAADPVPVSPEASTPSRPAPGTEVVVVLATDRRAWIAATIDGERRLYQNVPPGETHTLRGRRVTLRIGDAGAVRWSVNGRPAAPMGASGEVRDVTVTPADVAR